ncbi:hypothetical protein B484DRAFT_398605 [Ochromonadaceae sp. CCMP2298]|nr:hypothetical protein B484DRAFT_398605 [Ochromonadaceae sp. CCMP2298]
MIALKDHNVWGPGPPTVGGRLQTPLLPTQSLAGETLNTSFLGMMPEADARVTAYAAEYNVEDAPHYRAAEPADDRPSLAKLYALQSSVLADRKWEWRYRVQTNVDLLEGKSTFVRGRKRMVTAKEYISELDAPATRALLTQFQGSPVPPLPQLRNMNKRELAGLLSEACTLKHARVGKEAEPVPVSPEETASNIKQVLINLIGAHPFTCPIRAGAASVVGEADFNLVYDMRRTDVVQLEPVSLFSRAMQASALANDSGSMPSSCSAVQMFGASAASVLGKRDLELAGAQVADGPLRSASSSNEGEA